MAVFERGDAGGIIAAIFEPLQRVDEQPRDRTAPENADNAAHDLCLPFDLCSRKGPTASPAQVPICVTLF